MGFLDEVMEGTAEAESPKSFFWWAGIAAVAATVKNNVFLDKFYYKLYPNIYCFFVAKSGLRKGFPIGLAKDLVTEVGQRRVIAGRASVEAIINDLSTATTPKHGGPPITDAAGFVVSGEFSASIVRNPDALTILTDLYDGHYNKEWKSHLKTSGNQELKGVNITMLGGMNETHFNDLITEKEISGGFIARTLVVFEDKRALRNSLTKPPTVSFDIPKLASYLKKIRDVKGQMVWADDARDEFDSWYYKYDAEGQDDKTGIANRVHDHILKVAMLISMSQTPSLVIELPHIQEAMTKVLALVQNVKRVTEGQGKSVSSNAMKIIVTLLLAHPEHKMSRIVMLQKGRGQYDYMEFDRAIDTLVQSNIINTPRLVNGSPMYELEAGFVMQYMKQKDKKEDAV